jgi:tetratricopeptide (TPR) repeat protein
MVCNRCGNRNPLNSKFCRFCGSKLDEPGASKPVLPEEEFYVPTESPADRERVQRLLDEAFAQSEKGEMGAAIHACKEALVIDPRSVPVHSLLGLLYERVGEKDKAIAEYERVLELNPDSALERESLARLRGEQETPIPPPTLRSGSRPFHYANTMPIVAAATLGIFIILLAYHAASQVVKPANVEPANNKLVLNVRNYTEEGRQALLRRDYPSAMQAFRQALTQNPNDLEAQNGLRQAQQGLLLVSRPTLAPPALGMTPPQQATQPMSPRPQSGNTPQPGGFGPIEPVMPASGRQSRTTLSPPGGDAYANLPPLPGPQSIVRTPPRVASFPPSFNPAPPVPETPANAGGTNPPATGAGGSPGGSIKITKSGGALAGATNPPIPETLDSDGFEHQQSGIVSFRNGDYASALQEFQRAVAAFQEQQRRGVRSEEAADGIQTCQNFIKQCQVKLGR